MSCSFDCKPLVEFVVAGLEHAADLEALHRLHATDRTATKIIKGEQHIITHAHAQPDRQLASQDDIETAGCQIAQLALHHLLRQHGDLCLFRGHHAAQHCWLAIGTHDQSDLLDVGCSTCDARVFQRNIDRALPVLQWFAITADGGVRGHLQHAVADLALEATHHRQRGDQRGHAQRDPEDRRQRDEGDETVAAFCAQVAQADGDGDRFEHRQPFG
jgi:hypothetical protein